MSTIVRKALSVLSSALIIFVIFGSVFVQKSNAASLSSLKDTITTSRPSAATPISANAASGIGQLSVLANGSTFFASDSATIIRNGTVLQSNINVASQSAVYTTVYFGQTTSTAVQAGTDVLTVPVTARHTITFNTVTSIPASGTIVIQFPGATSNTASPSASSFGWNNLQAGNVSVSGASCGSLAVSTPGTVTCTVNSIVSGGAGITVTIGSTTPALINPTKSAAAGINDSWLVSAFTTDASFNTLDSSSTKVATIDSIQVLGTIEPTLTFTITGVNNGTNINTISGSCGSIVTNAGLATTPTSVNLGILNNGYISAAALQGNSKIQAQEWSSLMQMVVLDSMQMTHQFPQSLPQAHQHLAFIHVVLELVHSVAVVACLQEISGSMLARSQQRDFPIPGTPEPTPTLPH